MGVFDDSPKVLKLNLENKEIDTLFDGKKISQEYGGDFDGIKVHSSGNIFFSGGGGILVINPEGKLMARINFGNATNCAFDKEEFSCLKEAIKLGGKIRVGFENSLMLPNGEMAPDNETKIKIIKEELNIN